MMEKRLLDDEEPNVLVQGSVSNSMSKKRARRMRKQLLQTPTEKSVIEYRKKIEQAASIGDGKTALMTYMQMKEQQLPINPYVYRVVISVSVNAEDAIEMKSAIFGVYHDMKQSVESKVRADESVYSALIRLSSKARDYDTCHDLLVTMQNERIEPRLRTFSSLLCAYCEDGNIEKAIEVQQLLHDHAIDLTETEYIALLRGCISIGSALHFNNILEEYTDNIVQPSLEGWAMLKEWFTSEASYVDGRQWKCSIGTVDNNGICSVTGDQLISMELPKDQEDSLLHKIEKLVVTEDKRIAQWNDFKSWLTEFGPFDVLIDAANVGYFNQNFSGGGFSYKQIKLMLEHYEKKGKRVLVVLHLRRTTDDHVPVEYRDTLKVWKARNMMYNCHPGNNDDWYWLYAAVKLGHRTLLVTNDEMRDHHFQMIHTRMFARWKERHQVHYSIQNESMVHVVEPSRYSLRPQKIGSNWHFPSCTKKEWLVFELEME